MLEFKFHAIRSKRGSHQVPGVSVGMVKLEGRSQFRSAEECVEFVKTLCVVPGVYNIRVGHSKGLLGSVLVFDARNEGAST